MAKGEGNTKAGWRGDMVEAGDDVFDPRDEMDAPKGPGRDAAVFRWSRVRENPGWVWVLVLFILAMPIGMKLSISLPIATWPIHKHRFLRLHGSMALVG